MIYREPLKKTGFIIPLKLPFKLDKPQVEKVWRCRWVSIQFYWTAS